MSSSFENICQLMDLPRQFDPGREVDFHKRAAECFLGESAQLPAQLAEFSADTLRTYPFDDVAAKIVALQGPPKKAKNHLEDLRFCRKVLMIGRDTMNLCGENDLIKFEATKPISTLTTRLGEIADAGIDQKSGHKKLYQKAAKLSVRAAIAARLSLTSDFVKPISSENLFDRCQQSLSSELLVQPLFGTDENTYHKARRDFRAVVHLGMVSQLVEPSDTKLAYVQQGIDLNRMYGKRHRELKNQLPA